MTLYQFLFAPFVDYPFMRRALVACQHDAWLQIAAGGAEVRGADLDLAAYLEVAHHALQPRH